MTSQITKDFQTKSKLRKLADGGSPDPSMLGTGAAARAGSLLAGRGRQIDAAVDAATGTPAPAPVPAPAPAPAPQQVAQAPKKSGLRSMLGLADGGSYLDDGYNANRYQQSQLKDGGRVYGPGGRTDDKVGPVMLSDEEYVLPGDTADAIGRDKLDAIRLATHEFKDERKESALRKRADGGDGWYDDMMPMDHLADGGAAWNVDSKGTVRPNAFGDAAAGPGYQQPKLPPPQPGTAVQVGQPPMGQRPPIDITPPGSRTPPAAQVVDAVTDVTPKTAMSRAGSALRGAARVSAPVAGIAGAAQSFDDQSTGYRDHFQNSVGAESPLGSVAADAARVLSNVGDAATFGLAGRIGRGLAGIGNEGFVSGFLSPSDRDQYLQQRTQQTMGGGASGTSPVTAAASALRSDQGPALPVTPDSYQSRRLSEMGVPLDVQNSKPIVGADLRTAGTSQYQNLGTYGGNGNIYGKADDPSRPGRINNFVGVGAGASPSNAASGSGWVSPQTRSPLRTESASAPMPPQFQGGNAAREINARYDKMLQNGRGRNVEFGSDWSQRHGAKIEADRNSALAEAARDDTARANAQLNAATSLEVSRNSADASKYAADKSAETSHLNAMLSAQERAAKERAAMLETQRKVGEARQKGVVDAIANVTESRSAGDEGKAAHMNSVLSRTGPEIRAQLEQLTPDELNATLHNMYTMQEGRDGGLVAGRSGVAMTQNAALGALIGSGLRGLGGGGRAQAVDKVLSKVPKIGGVLGAIKPAERLTKFGTIAGGLAGAAATPEIDVPDFWDPIARDEKTGAALPAKDDLREVLKYGAHRVYNPFNEDVQTLAGRRTAKPNSTQEEAARRYRSALRD